MNTIAKLSTALATFDLADISQAFLDAEGLLNVVELAISDCDHTEEEEDALGDIQSHLELTTIPEIDDAIGSGYADDDYEEAAAELLEELHADLESLVSHHASELAQVAA